MSSPIVLDTTGTLEATLAAVDTFGFSLPSSRVLGVIFDSDAPIAARGPGFVMISPGGTFAAVDFDVTGSRAMTVIHGDWSIEPTETEYRVRAVGVDIAPEHADATIALGSSLRSEWIDPPLDVDVFTIELEEGDRFFVESASDVGGSVTMRIETPSRVVYFPFVATGPELAPSQVFEAGASGDYLLTVYSAGLVADVETRYRFRVVRESAAEAGAGY